MAGKQKIYDIKNLTAEELIHMLNQEGVKWGTSFYYGDTMTGIVASKSEMMTDSSGNPKTNEDGLPWYRIEVLRKNAKDELKAIKVKVAGAEDPFKGLTEGVKVVIKKPVYHRGYFGKGADEFKWENITAEAIKKA